MPKSRSIKMGMTPSPPGEYIRKEILAPLGLSVTRAAQIMRMHRTSFSEIVNGKARLSPEVALRIEKAFGVPMELMLGMQTAADIDAVRKQTPAVQVRRYVPKQESLPGI